MTTKMTTIDMTYGQALDRMEQIHQRLDELSGADTLSRAEEREFDAITGEFTALQRHLEKLDRAAAIASAGRGGGGLRLDRGWSGDYDVDPLSDPRSAVEPRSYRNPWDLRDVQLLGGDPGMVAGELRARALSAIERMPAANDRIRSAATNIIERFDSKDSRLARFALVTSQPAYMRAWSKMATNKQHQLTVEEQRALNDVDQYRAMSLTDSAGGFLVPFQLDPTVIITSAGVRNDIRQAARQVVATGDVWHGVASTAVQWSFDAEGSEVSDDSPPFAQPSIPNYMARGFVPITIEAAADEQNVAQEVGRLLAQGKADLEGERLITGTGSGEPTGIVTALAGSSSVVNSKTTDTFALADVYALHGSLPARYRANASWLSNNMVYNLIRQFDTYGGAGLWTTLGNGTPPNLMGYPNLEAEAIDGTITAGDDNYALIFGDFQNYVITDRLGMTVEFIPHLFHTANNRPSGQRGWFAYYRVGADSVNDAAFRLLDIT